MRLWTRKTNTTGGQTAVEAIAGQATTQPPMVLAVDECQELFSPRRTGRWSRAGAVLGQMVRDDLWWLYEWLGRFADRCVQYGPVLWGAAAGAAGAWWADGHPLWQVAATLWRLTADMGWGLLALAFLDMLRRYPADPPADPPSIGDTGSGPPERAEDGDTVHDVAHDVELPDRTRTEAQS